jgi:glycosyltransferase involved in cell wall biosynthesis
MLPLNKKVQISVIMPVHNRLSYFLESFKSIINQNFKSLEILIFSDGNSNSFNDHLKKIQNSHQNVKVFYSLKKLGIVKSLNFLISKAKGKYIARMDADDICLENRLREQFNYAEKYNKNYIFTAGCFYIDKKSKITGQYCPKEINIDILKYKNPLIHPTLFAHNSVFKKILYREIYLNEDYDFYYRAFLNNFKFIIIKKNLIYYRVTQKKNKIYLFYLYLINLILLKKAIRNKNILNDKYILNNLKEYDKEDYKDNKEFIKEFYVKCITTQFFFKKFFYILKNILRNKYIFLYFFLKLNIFKFFNIFSDKIELHKILPSKNLKKKNLLVSVIIPTRNSGKTIKKTINSVLKQTHKKIELIIVDDGSEDNTIDILNKFKNKLRIIKLRNKVLAGEARNEGINVSKGYFLAFCDSDDVWKKNKISEQLDYILKNNYDIVCCNAYSFKKNTILSTRYINFPFLQIKFQDLLSKNYVINSSVLIKKKIMLKFGMYPKSKFFFSFEDYYTWLKLSVNFNIGFLDKQLIVYNDNPRFSARNNTLSFYHIKLRIFLIFLYLMFTRKIKISDFLKLIKVFSLNILQLLFYSK